MTPGPWKVKPSAAKGQIVVYHEDEEGDAKLVARLYDDQEEDARAIAGLPGLMEAAEAMLQRIDTITSERFAAGGERVEREALRAALDACKEGKP